MMAARSSVALLLVALMTVLGITSVASKAIPDHEAQAAYPQGQQLMDPYGNHLVDDDGSLDAALINYLFAKVMVDRLRNNADVKDLQRKRSYWKQCAFNAVSCFGKRK